MIPVGLSTTSAYPLDVQEAFAIARDVGYDGMEVMVSYPKVTRDPASLRKLSDAYQLPIMSIHAPTLVLTQFTGGRDPITKIVRSCELAKAVDATTVVVHPPFSVQSSYYVNNFLKIINDLSAKFELNIAVENMFPWRVGGTRNIYTPTWDVIEDEANSLTIDFSHAALSGLDGYEMVQRNLGNVAHIHLCDGDGIQKLNGKNQVMDQHLLPGQGGQRIDESLSLLAAHQWRGSVVAEINTRGVKTSDGKAKMLDYTLNYARNAIQAGLRQRLKVS